MKKNDHLWSSFIQSQINLEPKNRICRANVWTQKDFWVLLSYGILPLCHIFFLFSALLAYFNYSFKFNNFSFTINMNSLSIGNRFFIWGKKSASQLILCLKKRKFLEWNSGKVIRMSDIRITVPDSFILPLSIDRSYDNIC